MWLSWGNQDREIDPSSISWPCWISRPKGGSTSTVPILQLSRTRMPRASVGKTRICLSRLQPAGHLVRPGQYPSPLVLSRRPVKEMMTKIDSVSRELAFTSFLRNTLTEISGGQKQRVAVARAIITSPEILLADEPTGALDSKSSAALLDVFGDINSMGQTILMVTHSTAAAAGLSACSLSGTGSSTTRSSAGKDRASDVPRNLGYPDGHGRVRWSRCYD